MTLISKATALAYEQAIYEVETPDRQTILLQTGNNPILSGPKIAQNWWLIVVTAYNPAECLFCADENMARNSALSLDLARLSVPVTSAKSYSEDESHLEPGFCVWLDANFHEKAQNLYQEVLQLAKKYSQAAVFEYFRGSGHVTYL